MKIWNVWNLEGGDEEPTGSPIPLGIVPIPPSPPSYAYS